MGAGLQVSLIGLILDIRENRTEVQRGRQHKHLPMPDIFSTIGISFLGNDLELICRSLYFLILTLLKKEKKPEWNRRCETGASIYTIFWFFLTEHCDCFGFQMQEF